MAKNSEQTISGSSISIKNYFKELTNFNVIEFLFNNYDKLTIQEMKLFNKLKHIFVEYLYSPRHTAIPMDGLYSDLKDLEDLLYKLAMPKKSKSKKPNITRRNYARGVQNKRSSITFKRKPKQRRFKKPFLMSIK